MLRKASLILAILLAHYALQAQSIQGRISSKGSKENLSYANINIYRGDSLMASVIADGEGFFHVKLDTGTYRCEIQYAGFKSETKTIRVTSDESREFSLDSDTKGEYRAEEMEEYLDERKRYKASPAPIRRGALRSSSTAYESLDDGWGGDDSAGSSYGESRSRRALRERHRIYKAWGVSASEKADSLSNSRLTAGEINDFSKFGEWDSLINSELAAYKEIWQFSPQGRYSMQLVDKTGIPVSNALVELRKGEEILFSSRTDNTGRAELWATLDAKNGLPKADKLNLRVSHQGKTQTVQNPSTSEKGINAIIWGANCQQSQAVDIAIVVDATGSMQDEIDYLKYELNQVIYQTKQFSNQLNINVANVFYKDTTDDYLSEQQDFTNVLSASAAYMSQHNAGGGGDTPEAVEVALDSAIHGLSWREDTRSKIILLVLDAPPHATPEVKNKMRQLARDAAAKGIRIVPVVGSGSQKSNEYLMRSLALSTNGTYVFLTNHSGIGNKHIEPSTGSYEVELLNDLLVRILKSYIYMPDCTQTIADLGVHLPDSSVRLPNSDSTAMEELSWQYYPNPTDGLLNIRANQDIQELYISDLSGKALLKIRNIRANSNVQVDLQQYPTGIYLIRYAIGKRWVSGKVLLRRG